MCAQSVTSAYQITAGLKITANENWKDQTPTYRHIKYRQPNYVNSNSVLHFMSIYLLKILLYQQ